MQYPADWQAMWRQAWQLCQANRWRLPLWISGEQAFVHSTLASVLAAAPAGGQIGWLGALPTWLADGADAMPENLSTPPAVDLSWRHLQFTPVSGQARQQVLGREFDWLVVNTQSGTDWDLVAASIGCVKAGGLWILLTAEPATFAGSANPLASKVLSYPTDAAVHTGHFHAYTLAQLVLQPVFHINATHSGWCHQPTAPIAATNHSDQLSPYATPEQQQAVAAICKVASGHRNRPLVLTAHRGRGKSAALGIAAAQLYAAGKQRLIVTAPQPAAARVALDHANAPEQPKAADSDSSRSSQSSKLQFWSIDRLLQELPPVDLLFVDEAAAIPTPQLEQLARHYHRIVFATTEHGYEGSGRGFQLRFLGSLRQLQPQYRQLHLEEPVRFGEHDPLETLSFAWFQLSRAERPVLNDDKAQIVEAATRHTQPDWPNQSSISWHRGLDLQREPGLLQQVMSLAALAHYQTTVRDLWALLDDPLLLVVIWRQETTVLALAIISQEGNLPADLATAVLEGKRRVQGHLGAQSLAFHLAIPELAQVLSWRIQRIMVQPVRQGQRLGRQLLQHIRQTAIQQQVALLTTSFGATARLASFWQREGFAPVRLSDRPDQRSNEFSVLMLSALQPALIASITSLQKVFRAQLWHSLSKQHQRLEPALALAWATPAFPGLTPQQRLQVELFARGARPISDSWYALTLFFTEFRQYFPQDQQIQWVSYCWQQQAPLSQSQLSDWLKQSVQAVLQQIAAPQHAQAQPDQHRQDEI